MLWLLAFSAMAGDINNPGGARIPYVKLQSDVWDVVVRSTGPGRARIERVRGKCGEIWINGCAAGVDPGLRQVALHRVFQDAIQLSGDFTYCSTAVVREVPQDLARAFIRASTDDFCVAFTDPESVRDERMANATQGENDLVNRLMGGKNTTSGRIRMKAPVLLENPTSPVSPAPEPEPTGRRAEPERVRSSGPPAPPAPVQTQEAVALEARRTASATDGIRETSTDAAPMNEPVAAVRTNGGGRSGLKGELDSTQVARGQDLLADEDEAAEVAVFEAPPEPEPAPADPELDALLAPLPGLPEREQVVVPAPRPSPTRSATEAERLEAENDALQRIGRGEPEDDKRKKKDKKRKKEDEIQVGTDQEFGDYILIDIESLPDED